MKLRHVISASQFDTKTISALFGETNKIKNGKNNKQALSGKILASLFYEPSTRTRLSFEAAMLRLGGKVISTENAKEFSSVAKGETLADTIRVISSFCDVVVLRHFQQGASEIAAQYSKVPIINAGDGNGEHPTQALLDLYTIFSKFPAKDWSSSGGNLTIAMIGDLANGRTIHSLSYLLSLYPKIKIIFVSPKALAIPNNLRDNLKQKNTSFVEIENLKEGLDLADVVYQTRIQKERFKSTSDYKKYFGKYIIDKNSLKFLKKKAVIMHPLPRINEIAPEVDSDKRAIYFEQAQNGLYIRMALLLWLLAERGPKGDGPKKD